MEFGEVTQVKNLISSTFPSLFASPEIAKHIMPWTEFFSFFVREMGYCHLQATKPDTVGVGLTHTPLGLAAYIMEKFSTYTNRTWITREDGGIEEKFTLDELLDNIMVYWVTGSITTSQRLYAEVLKPTKVPNLDRYLIVFIKLFNEYNFFIHCIFILLSTHRVPTNVPFDCMYMPGDLFVLAQYAISHKFTNITKFSVAPRGGHFGAFEEPQILAEDALSFFNSL